MSIDALPDEPSPSALTSAAQGMKSLKQLIVRFNDYAVAWNNLAEAEEGKGRAAMRLERAQRRFREAEKEREHASGEVGTAREIADAVRISLVTELSSLWKAAQRENPAVACEMEKKFLRVVETLQEAEIDNLPDIIDETGRELQMINAFGEPDTLPDAERTDRPVITAMPPTVSSSERPNLRDVTVGTHHFTYDDIGTVELLEALHSRNPWSAKKLFMYTSDKTSRHGVIGTVRLTEAEREARQKSIRRNKRSLAEAIESSASDFRLRLLQLCGFSAYLIENGRAVLNKLTVDPAARDTRLPERLLQEVYDDAAQRKLTSIQAVVNGEDEWSMDFLTRQRFEIVEVRSSKSNDGLYVMEKKL
ncbi:MAG: hypothetical protein Greene041619_790 [Candidatus Peregrinibacteria bacterium Greene0416_19]|nr:MAG: hypothetical protein Greene041619_790 [Candidatus Peregrinibacteria bacterium Greene0416_19]